MTDRQAKKWAVTRAKGRHHFILLFGVLFWGLSTAIMWAALMTAMHGPQMLPSVLPFALIGFPAGGYLWGALMWRLSERTYRKAIAAGQSSEAK